MKESKIYVTMTDGFMSGWGKSYNRRNKYVVVCDTEEQAAQIYRNARKRPEMSRVNLRYSFPRYNPETTYTTYKRYSDLSGTWLE